MVTLEWMRMWRCRRYDGGGVDVEQCWMRNRGCRGGYSDGKRGDLCCAAHSLDVCALSGRNSEFLGLRDDGNSESIVEIYNCMRKYGFSFGLCTCRVCWLAHVGPSPGTTGHRTLGPRSPVCGPARAIGIARREHTEHGTARGGPFFIRFTKGRWPLRAERRAPHAVPVELRGCSTYYYYVLLYYLF